MSSLAMNLVCTFLVPAIVSFFIAFVTQCSRLPLPTPYQDYQVSVNISMGTVLPLEGPLATNTHMQEADQLFKNTVVGPETVVFDAMGRMYLFTGKGIYRASPIGDSFEDAELFVEVIGGRPLSGAFDSNGTLYFCIAVTKGLMKLNVEERKYETVLSSDSVSFCDDLVISSTDEIYIADASDMRALSPEGVLETSIAAVAANSMTGRLLKYTPTTGVLETLISNITFANGVSLAHDESFVLVSASGSTLSVLRYWLKGEKSGRRDVFIDGLPGYSDGVSRSADGATYWVAIFSRIDDIQSVLLRHRILRWIATHLPSSVQHKLINMHDMVIQVDGEGKILRSFHDPGFEYGRTTSVAEHKGKIYIGSFGPLVKVIDLKKHPL